MPQITIYRGGNTDSMDIGSALLPIGIIPALFILYFTLGGYEEKFQDKYIFLTFLGGIAMGTAIYFVDLWVLSVFNYQVLLESIDVLLVVSLMLAFFEHAGKLVVLNLPRFQRDEGTILYGASLGGGFASVAGAILMQNVDTLFSIDGGYAAMTAIGLLLVSCATGMMLGMGVKVKSRFRYLALASLAGMVVWPFLLYVIGTGPSIYTGAPPLGYGVILFAYIRGKSRPFLLGRRELKEAYRRRWWKGL